MTVTAFTVKLVRICGYLTGTRSWMIIPTRIYRLWLDGCFYIICANLSAIGYTFWRTYSERATEFIFPTVIKVYLLIVAMTSNLYNLSTRKKRQRLEVSCSHLLEEYGQLSRLPILYIPIFFFTTLTNFVVLTSDVTLKSVTLCYFSAVVNDSAINLKTLAIAHRLSEIAASLDQMTEATAHRLIPTAMEAHRDCFKLVGMLNECHMLDYFLQSITTLVRIVYIVIGMIQDVKNGTAHLDERYALDLVSSLSHIITISGRYLLSCWSGTRLTTAREESIEAMLNFQFYNHWQLNPNSRELVNMLIHQLDERRVSLSVFGMFDMGLGTYTSFVEVAVTYVLVVVNTIGAKSAEMATSSQNSSSSTTT